MHLQSLEKYSFDSVLLPYNYSMLQNNDYKEGFEKLTLKCSENNIAVQAIKTLAKGPKQENSDNQFSTWYEPLSDPEDIQTAIHWALGNDQIFINTAADIHLLPFILQAFKTYSNKISNEEMKEFVSDRNITPLFS
jgi:hypothetical protein